MSTSDADCKLCSACVVVAVKTETRRGQGNWVMNRWKGCEGGGDNRVNAESVVVL
jgi:hypothetical protein